MKPYNEMQDASCMHAVIDTDRQPIRTVACMQHSRLLVEGAGLSAASATDIWRHLQQAGTLDIYKDTKKI